MKILLIITGLNRGGAENHVVDLAIGMHKRNVEVIVVVLKNLLYLKEKLDEHNIQVKCLLMNNYFSLKALLVLINIIANEKPDIIHAHLPPAELLTYFALKIAKQKAAFVITKHTDEYFIDSLRMKLNWVARIICQRADVVVCVSEAVRKHFLSVGFKESKLQVVYHGLDPTDFVKKNHISTIQARQKLGIPQNMLVVGTVSRLEPGKNLDKLIKAVCQCVKMSSVILVIVGDGKLGGELQEMINENNLQKSAILLGRRVDVPAILCAFDIFVFISQYEGFGMVLLEAMAAKLPVIASNVSAIPEVVVSGETAILVDPNSEESIIKAITALNNVEQRQAMGNAGYKHLLEKFSLEIMIRNTSSVYEKVINKNIP